MEGKANDVLRSLSASEGYLQALIQDVYLNHPLAKDHFQVQLEVSEEAPRPP